jgi:nuclear pore complex protein Nup210
LDWWQEAKQNVPRPMLKGLTSASLLVPWMVWKQRNSCVFEGALPSTSHTMALIKAEAVVWARAGALGLRTILPTTWKVH